MDIMSAIMILVPLLVPMGALCGVDPVHLGLIFIVNLEIGYLTPPMGLNLFVSSSLFKEPLGVVVRSVVPFTGVLLAALLIVTYVPTVALGPVNWLKDRPFYAPFPQGEVCKVEGEEEEGGLFGAPPPVAAPTTEAQGVKSLEDLMKESNYDDAFDDKPAAPSSGPKSLQDLMKEGNYEDAFDDAPKAPPSAAPDTRPKSLQDLMKEGNYEDAFDDAPASAEAPASAP